MEIYIDNEKFNYQSRKKNIGRIIKAINKKLEANEKIIKNIYINGNILNEDTIIDLTKQNIIEVETSSYADILLEAIENAKIYIEIFFETREYILTKLENNEEIIDLEVEETHNFIEWFTDLLQFLNENYYFDEIRGNLFTMIDDLRMTIEVLNEKRKEEDYIGYLGILEYAVVDYLYNFMENIDYCYKMILEDEKNKKLMN